MVVVEMVMVEMWADHDGRTVVVRSGPRAIGVARAVIGRAIVTGTVGIVWVNRLLTGHGARGAGQQDKRCEDPTSTHAFDMARARGAVKIARPLASKRDPR
jgi:hypothetical protein